MAEHGIKRSLSQKILLGFSAIVVLFVITSLTSSYLLNRIEQDLYLLTEVEDPLEQSSLEMEINAGESARAVFEYVRHEGLEQLARLEDAESDFELHSSHFLALATDKRIILQAKKIAVLYRELKVLTQNILERLAIRRMVLTQFITKTKKIDYYIAEDLFAVISLNAESEQLILKLTIFALEAFSDIETYALDANPSYLKEIAVAEGNVYGAINNIKNMALTDKLIESINSFEREFRSTMLLGNQAIKLTNEIDGFLRQYEAGLDRIDDLLDDNIQPLINKAKKAAVDDAYKAINLALAITWAMNIIGIILAIFISKYFSHLIAGSMQTLVKGAKKIGQGDLKTRIDLKGNDEFSYLSETLNKTMDKLWIAQSEERRSVQKTQAILDTAADGIILIDKRGRIKTFNNTAIAIFGYQADEVIGKNVKVLMPQEPHQEHDSYLTDFMGAGDEKTIGVVREVVGLRKDGSTFAMDLAVSEIIYKSYLDDEEDDISFMGIVRDITERKKVEQAKAEFVSSVSHELRTPLTSIKGALGLAVSGSIGKIPENLKGMLDIAYKNTDRLILLINDILDMEKITAGKLEFDMQVMDACLLISEAIETNKSYADQHKVEFVNLNQDKQYFVRGDKHRLMQVMANLMSNAAKFSPENSMIEISAQRIKENIRISVKDYGQGIPENFKDTIFEKFTQADASDTRKKGGTGLGLSISKSFVEKHGSELRFDTEEGKGSDFYFDLSELQEYSPDGVFNEFDSGLPHLLICEDNSDISTFLTMVVGNIGFSTSAVATVAQAKLALENNKFSVMTLDLDLPDGDGLDMLRELRKLPKTEKLPVVVISANAEDFEKKHRDDRFLNVFEWMQKPIEITDLTRTLRKLINPKPHILHLEGDESVLKVVESIVIEDAIITPARTIKQAEILLLNEVFDLVILDLVLPDGNGEDLLPLVNKQGCPPVPVIVFSVNSASSDKLKYIHKSLIKSQATNSDLLQVIRSTLKLK